MLPFVLLYFLSLWWLTCLIFSHYSSLSISKSIPTSILLKKRFTLFLFSNDFILFLNSSMFFFSSYCCLSCSFLSLHSSKGFLGRLYEEIFIFDYWIPLYESVTYLFKEVLLELNFLVLIWRGMLIMSGSFMVFLTSSIFDLRSRVFLGKS